MKISTAGKVPTQYRDAHNTDSGEISGDFKGF